MKATSFGRVMTTAEFAKAYGTTRSYVTQLIFRHRNHWADTLVRVPASGSRPAFRATKPTVNGRWTITVKER